VLLAESANAAQALLDRAWGSPRKQNNLGLMMRKPSPSDFRPDLTGIHTRVIALASRWRALSRNWWPRNSSS
jgi:hypothetical protein